MSIAAFQAVDPGSIPGQRSRPTFCAAPGPSWPGPSGAGSGGRRAGPLGAGHVGRGGVRVRGRRRAAFCGCCRRAGWTAWGPRAAGRAEAGASRPKRSRVGGMEALGPGGAGQARSLSLPGGLVVRIRRSHRRGPGSIPGQGSLSSSSGPPGPPLPAGLAEPPTVPSAVHPHHPLLAHASAG